MMRCVVVGVVALVWCVCAGVVVGQEAGANVPVTVKVNGYFQLDTASYDSSDVSMESGSELRRARVKLSGNAGRDWKYKLQWDLVDSGKEGLRDAYVQYVGIEDLGIYVGQFAEPGSLDDLTSSRFIAFMERALPVLAFEPAIRRMGVAGMANGEHWTLAAGLFGEDLATGNEGDGWGVRARGTWAPRCEAGDVLHLGLSGGYRDAGSEAELRWRSRPEAHVDGLRIVDTGVIAGADDYVSLAAEVAWVRGPLAVQGEYLAQSTEGDESLWLDGYYLFASYFLTGESRVYDAGSAIFTRVTPRAALGDGGYGAWEVAVRYSELDLSDVGDAGKASDWTAGVNWYPVDHLRFTVNYVLAHVADGPEGDVDTQILQARAQVDF